MIRSPTCTSSYSSDSSDSGVEEAMSTGLWAAHMHVPALLRKVQCS
jgi:hypothetical protein